MLYECPKYDDERQALKDLITERGLQLRQEDMMADKKVREVFFQTARRIMKRKEES